jgi:hypothetical protein
MAALNFPANPVDGELYPDPAPAGATQYVYNGTKGTWLTVFRGVERVSTRTPLFTSGTSNNPVINIPVATPAAGGYMSAADKTKLDSLGPSAGTVTSITAGTGIGAPATGNSIVTAGTLNLLPPTPLAIGGVRGGTGVSITTQGVLNLLAPTTANIGGVKAGAGLTISADGTISLASSGAFVVIDSLASQFNGVKVTFQLTVNGIPYAPAGVNNLLLYINGAFQIPISAFSVQGSSVTFTSAPPTGASFYGISLT